MSLYTHIEKQIDGAVENFCKLLCEKYDDLEEEELMLLWKEFAKTKKPKRAKKKSAYQIFYKIAYAEVKSLCPEMGFGDIAKEISKQWRQFSPEQKKAFASASASASAPAPAPAPLTEVVESYTMNETESPMVNESETIVDDSEMDTSPMTSSPDISSKKKKKTDSPHLVEAYEKNKITELKKMCKERGLEFKGMTKKMEFIELLSKYDQEMTKFSPDLVNESPLLV